jgi:membrane-bound lytic murein transglycosylase D
LSFKVVNFFFHSPIKKPFVPANLAFINAGMKQHILILFIIFCLPLKFASGSGDVYTTVQIKREIPPGNPEVDLTDIKNIPDLYFECQIAQMAENSEIPLFYNSLVREYIEIYLMGRKKQIPELRKLSDTYFPIFETQLSDKGLPDELKYLPIIESGLNPNALSPSNARGLWQFKAETGRSFGLVVNENSDERSDPAKSTMAACNYLKYLNSIFGDWQLSLLAYHAGPTTIKNAIKKAGGKTKINDIYNFLPIATQRYLPAYIAVMYVMNNYKNHI